MLKHFRFLVFFGIFLFLSCSSEEKQSPKFGEQTQESVQIEQSDEKTELSDTNLPLPVEDDDSQNQEFEPSPSVIGYFYKQKCANCHGKKGEVKTDTLILKKLNKQSFIEKLKAYQNSTNAKLKEVKAHSLNLSQEQIENLADYVIK